MCINPRIHASGLSTPCHQCWQCKENRVNDWVGRCIAEKETSLACSVTTLTYGGGDCAEARFLRKSDITQYMKTLRNKGHRVRHFAVGEYGSMKGRSHWHIVLFWQSPMPHLQLRKNINDEYWPYGYSFWDQCDQAGIRYAMKYINKDFGDQHALRSMSMSKKPMLGSQFFSELAARYVAAGLVPQKPFYKFADVLNKHGKPQEFYMPPLVAERFALLYIAHYRAKHSTGWWPSSEFIDKYHDKSSGFIPDIYQRPYRRGDEPWMLPPPGYVQRFDEPLNSFYAEGPEGRLFWSFDETGQRAWLKNLVTASQGERLSEAYAAQRQSVR